MKYKIPPDELLKFNQLEPKDFTIVGKTIKIPQKHRSAKTEPTTETPPSKTAPNENILKNMWK